MRKKILVVCMLNSIHSSKWLAQFKNLEVDFYIFPSAYFRSLHPLMDDLINSDSTAKYQIQFNTSTAGWIDFFQERILSKFISHFSRRNRLQRYIRSSKPQIVHALEFQHSAYLCAEVFERFGKEVKFISTNWGSDIFHFRQIPEHLNKIKEVLKFSDQYSAECSRDYSLASELGYTGNFLPVIPNSGGFRLADIKRNRSRTSSRRLILIKGYGGYFGRVNIVLEILEEILNEFKDYSIFLYSVTDDTLDSVQEFKLRFHGRVDYSTVRNPLPYQSLQELFDSARIYIGCSISDGISTSFLEALVSGAYPIQTNTSCAVEWIKKGALGSIISLDKSELLFSIQEALSNDEMVDRAQHLNTIVALENLESQHIAKSALTFY